MGERRFSDRGDLMTELRQGDILKSDVEALVNTVNCVGIAGRGIALQFRKAFPENFVAYCAACRRGVVEPGRVFVYETRRLSNPKFVINFPTKRHWRGRSRISDIESGLRSLIFEVRRLGVKTIAIPPLGCGLGGLSWSDVRPKIVSAMSELPDVHAILFEPAGAPSPSEITKSGKVPKMTPGRAALVGLMKHYLAGLMDPFVSLLEIHKLMYFMQEAGEPLRLRYNKAPYGPYAENLRQVLSAIEGHLVSGYADGGDKPDKVLELVPGAVRDAEQFLGTEEETRSRFDRVADVVDGFETPFGLELLSTVHWVATREGASTPQAAIDLTHAWGERKRRYTPNQIRIAWNILAEKGWLSFPTPGMTGQR
jgi:O-acetyl-ADP-ribose deacetylase (regulator of RNase III)